MSLNVLRAFNDNNNEIYRSPNEPNFVVRSATVADDEQLVKLIAETMPSNGMTLAFERYPSYLGAAMRNIINLISSWSCQKTIIPKLLP